MLTQVILGGVNGHPIDAGTALVASNALPRSFEILLITYLLHELFRQGRAFGCWLRHQRFGILGLGVQGFTPTLRHRGLRRLLAQRFLPHSAHELSVLIATLNRSGLHPGVSQRGMMEDGLVRPVDEGTGGPLSPILSNLVLDDLDKELARRRSRLAHQQGSGACPVIRRSSKPYATPISSSLGLPESMRPPKPNSVEPPWYGPVCPVVWEGWRREASPCPDLTP